MEEDLLDRDLDDELRPVALDDEVVEVGGVGHDRRPPVDPQRVAATGDHEQQPDVGIPEDVSVAVGTPVARPFRDRDRRGVDDMDESSRIALR